ncbi:MAG: imidazole glycerol phosphate synthase subunit HisF [Candidatus Melainabacteria bacterium RIFCSPHIGHO2_02_FULL_34_12]|nr:MAG: imidazole glycerol phosphate synthase subunit HisF [Candidatus Melainabacteria bacterium RIFCSPHIGHO2_02_FULL_34_12]
MLAKRIIPCLDIKDGRVVKGTKFLNLKDAGDPVELAKYYNEQGADELCFLDITASHEERKTIIEIVEAVAKQVFIPFTVGGGISTVDQMKDILRAGADKITINTSAIKNPDLIKEGARAFGSQCIVLAIDAKKEKAAKWKVYIKGGRENTGLDVIEWAKKAVSLGAGEILLTSMDADGTKEGYDIELTKAVVDAVNVPVIASGGAGKIEHVTEVFKKTNCDAALLASILHYKDVSIKQIKELMKKEMVAVR